MSARRDVRRTAGLPLHRLPLPRRLVFPARAGPCFWKYKKHSRTPPHCLPSVSHATIDIVVCGGLKKARALGEVLWPAADRHYRWPPVGRWVFRVRAAGARRRRVAASPGPQQASGDICSIQLWHSGRWHRSPAGAVSVVLHSGRNSLTVSIIICIIL
jgi:hypothetical protein